MARETINRDNVGKTEYVADVQYRVPLADPNGIGNRGLDGYDEDTETRRFPTFEEAAAWALAFQPENGEADYYQIDTVEWVADEYDDDQYGTILDAVENTIESQAYDHSTGEWYPL